MMQRNDANRVVAVLLSTLVAMTTALSEDRMPVSPEDILAIRWVSNVALSPDATQVAYLIREPANVADAKSEGQTHLWIASTDKSNAPRRLALGHSDVSAPQWSPDGLRLAFLSKGNAKTRGKQVWLMTLNGELPICLTQAPEGVAEYCWSPDGQEIALTSPEAVAATQGPIEVDRHHGHHRLWVVRIADRTMHRVTEPDKHVTGTIWSPNGVDFAAVLSPSNDMDEVDADSKLVMIDRTTGTVKRTLSDKVNSWMRGNSWSPDGTTIAFFEYTGTTFACRLALVNATNGERRYLLGDYQGTPEDYFAPLKWTNDSRYLFVSAIEGTRSRLLRVDTTNGSFQRLTESMTNCWSSSLSADCQTIAVSADDGSSPADVFILKAGQEPTRLTDLNSRLSTLRLGKVSEIRWTSRRDGKTIYGVLITPDDFVPGKPRKTIVQLHGGVQWLWFNGWAGDWDEWGQMLASHGYVVLLPNPRGSLGQGWDFSDMAYRDWGGGDFHDVMDGIDLLVEQRIADPDRLGVGGWSYGGILSASATTQTNRFKAAIVGASSPDLSTVALTAGASTIMRRHFGMDAILGRDDLLFRLSPLARVDQCKTPTLVLHCEKDDVCPIYHGRAWYRSLKLRGVDSQMVIYPGAGHVLSERGQQLDLMRRVLTWYDEHLGNER